VIADRITEIAYAAKTVHWKQVSLAPGLHGLIIAVGTTEISQKL